jgi:DNA-binding FadR family transcriptional regulator
MIDSLGPAISPTAFSEQHRALLAAIEDGDSTAAERAMTEHLLYVRSALHEASGG